MSTLTMIFATLALAATFTVGDTTAGGGSGMDDTSVVATDSAAKTPAPAPTPAPRQVAPGEDSCLSCF